MVSFFLTPFACFARSTFFGPREYKKETTRKRGKSAIFPDDSGMVMKRRFIANVKTDASGAEFQGKGSASRRRGG
jgi:hypothetical protein